MAGAASSTNPSFQVYGLLRAGFTLLPILAGVDKFFNWMVYWPQYLAEWVDNIFPGSAQDLMYAVGAIEILVGLLVAIVPRIGAPLIAVWLAGIIINLLTLSPPNYYDIALRDLGLLLAAVGLTRLAWAFHGDTAKSANAPPRK